MIEPLYLSLLCLSAALLCYIEFHNYSLIRSISCSCSTCCSGLGFQHENLRGFMKIIRALIKDIFLRECRSWHEGVSWNSCRVRHRSASHTAQGMGSAGDKGVGLFSV